MRLALVYHQFLTRGGLEGYLRELLKQFRAAGHDVELLGGKIDAEFRAAASAVHVIPPPLLGKRRWLQNFAKTAALRVSELKVDATLGFGRTWRQNIHRAGGGCHAVYSRQLPWHKRLSPKNRLELELEKRLYTWNQTEHFVVNAPMVGLEIQENYGVKPERITVIPTGVDTEHWRPADSSETRREIREKLHPGIGDRPVLLFVSLDHGRKGLSPLFQSLALLPEEIVLWVAGKGLSRDYAKQMHRLGITDRVRVFGRQADLRPFYQAADLFVHPSNYDACANTVLQSLASGLPGVISQQDGAHFHIQEGENGFLLTTPHDPDCLKTAVAKGLAANRQLLGAAGRKCMEPIHWAAHVGRWMELLEQVPLNEKILRNH